MSTLDRALNELEMDTLKYELACTLGVQDVLYPNFRDQAEARGAVIKDLLAAKVSEEETEHFVDEDFMNALDKAFSNVFGDITSEDTSHAMSALFISSMLNALTDISEEAIDSKDTELVTQALLDAVDSLSDTEISKVEDMPSRIESRIEMIREGVSNNPLLTTVDITSGAVTDLEYKNNLILSIAKEFPFLEVNMDGEKVVHNIDLGSSELLSALGDLVKSTK